MDFKFLTRTIILATAGGALMLPALAKWQWIDNNGRKVFSDQAPPANIPQKNILKEPGTNPVNPPQDVATGTPAPASMASAPVAKASMSKLSGKDAEIEAQIKQAKPLEEIRKRAEEEKTAYAKADNCERAKRGQAALKSGVRIAFANTKGEREFMDDNARSLESKRLQAITESECVK